jgi:hypothetical protein
VPVSNSRYHANILDPIHTGLSALVWNDPEGTHPKLKRQHATWIKRTIYGALSKAGYTDIEKWLSLFITGSITTYQYSDLSDLDVSLFVDTKVFPEWSRAEMIGLMVGQVDGTKLPGTPFPLQDFVVPPGVKPTDLYKQGLRSGYSLDTDGWINPPEREHIKDVQQEENGFYIYALECADKMERLLRYEPDKAVQYWHQIHKRRQRDQKAGRGDFTESNIAYKMLAQRSLFPQIAETSGEYIAKAAMAETSGFPDLDQHVAEYIQAHPELQDLREPANAWGRCEEISEGLANHLKERGYQAYATSDELGMFGYKGNQKTEDIGAGDFTYPEHSVVEVYGLPNMGVNNVTIDLTAAQYGHTGEWPKVHGGPGEHESKTAHLEVQELGHGRDGPVIYDPDYHRMWFGGPDMYHRTMIEHLEGAPAEFPHQEYPNYEYGQARGDKVTWYSPGFEAEDDVNHEAGLSPINYGDWDFTSKIAEITPRDLMNQPNPQISPIREENNQIWKLSCPTCKGEGCPRCDETGYLVNYAPDGDPWQGHDGAEEMANLQGHDEIPHLPWGDILPNRQGRTAAWQDWTNQIEPIAQAYERLPTYDPQAALAWKELADNSMRRAAQIGQRLNVQVTDDPEPYANHQEMFNDINQGRFQVSRANSEHPIWTPEQNVAFRTVHDVEGHHPTGGDFSWAGENKACGAHAATLPPLAQKALMTECLGQTGWAIHNGGFGPQKVGYMDPEIPSAQTQKTFSSLSGKTALSTGHDQMPEGGFCHRHIRHGVYRLPHMAKTAAPRQMAKFVYSPIENKLVLGEMGREEGDKPTHHELARANWPVEAFPSLAWGHVGDNGYVETYGRPHISQGQSQMNPYEAQWMTEEALRRSVPHVRFLNPQDQYNPNWALPSEPEVVYTGEPPELDKGGWGL